MRRYEMHNDYEPYTGQHLGIIGVPDDCGDWVRAEDAERVEQQRDRLKVALEELLEEAQHSDYVHYSGAADKARAALEECES